MQVNDLISVKGREAVRSIVQLLICQGHVQAFKGRIEPLEEIVSGLKVYLVSIRDDSWPTQANDGLQSDQVPLPTIETPCTGRVRYPISGGLRSS